MLIVAESVSALKRTLARILVLIVAVGFGYVKCASAVPLRSTPFHSARVTRALFLLCTAPYVLHHTYSASVQLRPRLDPLLVRKIAATSIIYFFCAVIEGSLRSYRVRAISYSFNSLI